MKPLSAILFSALLLWSQIVFTGAASAGEPEQGLSISNLCSCARPCCVNSAPTPAPQPLPAAPSRTLSNDQVPSAATGLLALIRPRRSDSLLRIPAHPCLQAAAVPVYQRNCSYLI
jgi:hypothetical protein